MLMRDGGVAWKLPTAEALRRVEELEECNIFPPQVTIAARRMQLAGRLPGDLPLPTTVEEGKEAFRSLRWHPSAPPEKAGEKGEETVRWTAPGYQPPAPITYREKNREAETRQAAAPRLSEGELQRAADKIYRIIEDRIRQERRRLGL